MDRCDDLSIDSKVGEIVGFKLWHMFKKEVGRIVRVQSSPRGVWFSIKTRTQDGIPFIQAVFVKRERNT